MKKIIRDAKRLTLPEQKKITGGLVCAPLNGGNWIKVIEDQCPPGYYPVPRPRPFFPG